MICSCYFLLFSTEILDFSTFNADHFYGQVIMLMSVASLYSRHCVEHITGVSPGGLAPGKFTLDLVRPDNNNGPLGVKGFVPVLTVAGPGQESHVPLGH